MGIGVQFWIQDFEVGVLGREFGVWGWGFRVEGLGCGFCVLEPFSVLNMGNYLGH